MDEGSRNREQILGRFRRALQQWVCRQNEQPLTRWLAREMHSSGSLSRLPIADWHICRQELREARRSTARLAGRVGRRSRQAGHRHPSVFAAGRLAGRRLWRERVDKAARESSPRVADGFGRQRGGGVPARLAEVSQAQTWNSVPRSPPGTFHPASCRCCAIKRLEAATSWRSTIASRGCPSGSSFSARAGRGSGLPGRSRASPAL